MRTIKNRSNKHTIGQNIDSKDISVVIQGKLQGQSADSDINAAIESLRGALPAAEIIISTWEYERCDDIDADKIVQSVEPRAFRDNNGRLNNILRQITSTKNGIKASGRPYVLKWRPDLRLESRELVKIWEYPAEIPQFRRMFESRITLTNLFIPDASRDPTLFHISDVVQFGRRDDLLELWSSKLPCEEYVFMKNGKPPVLGNFSGYTAFRLLPEQVLTLSWLERKGADVDLPYINYSTMRLMELWERVLSDNFYVMNWQESGISFPERFHISFIKRSLYTSKEMQVISSRLDTSYYRLRYLRHIGNKYLLCWFKRNYWFSFLHLMSWRHFPSVIAKHNRS